MRDCIRLDVGGFRSKPERTQQGFLKVPANLTRTGVLTYATPDGGQVREYRPAEEVFKADSIASMHFAPITNRHPSALVSPSNVRALQRGIVTNPRRDGRFLAGDLIVQDQQMIDQVEGREVSEISSGYNCQIEDRSGVSPEGERFDVIQRNIVYNHVAGGPPNWGRAGNDVRIRLDSIGEDLWPMCAVELRIDQASLTPGRDMDREELQSLREKRSERFGIEILESGSNLTFPADYPKSLEDYADPVNLKYPISPDGRARNARARFKQAANEYSNRRSRAVIHERIVRRLLEIGARPSINPDDPLDRLLPDSLKREAEKARRGDSRRTKGRTMDVDLITVRIDDLDTEVPKTARDMIVKALGSRDATIKDFAVKFDSLQGKHDALAKENEDLKKRLDAATDPASVQAAVNARLALVSSARKVLGEETKLDAMTDREIKVAVITKHDSEFKADDRSDDYVQARFDAAIKLAPAQSHQSNQDDIANALNRQQSGQRNDGNGNNEPRIDSADAARRQRDQDVGQLWRKDLRSPAHSQR